jgi:hypothetical protein
VSLARFAAALILFSAPSATLHGQEVIVHEKPVRVRHLAGRVVDSTGAGVAYTAIELRDATDHHVLASTFGDAKGDFFFADRKRGEKLEIRVSRTGFRIVQYAISLGVVGKPRLRIVLPAAA